MSSIELGSTVYGPVMGVISYFRMKGLLASQVDYQKCHVAMVDRSRSDVSDRFCVLEMSSVQGYKIHQG